MREEKLTKAESRQGLMPVAKERLFKGTSLPCHIPHYPGASVVRRKFVSCFGALLDFLLLLDAQIVVAGVGGK